MSQSPSQGQNMSEEEMIGLQFQGNRQRKEEKLGAYYKWASQPDENKTVEDDVLKGFLSKDIKLANLNSSEVKEIATDIDMIENIMRCLQPAGTDKPELETQFIAQKGHMKGVLSSGKHGFERNAQMTQVSHREVSTNKGEDSGGIRSKISGVFK